MKFLLTETQMIKKSPSKKEADDLITSNFAIVVDVAKTFKPKNHTELEDYISAGSLGLVRAAYSYDNSVALFSTHAYCCIKNEIIRYIKKVRKHEGCIQLQETVYEIKNNEYNHIIELSNLTKYEKSILEMKRSGYSNTEIAEILEISKAKLKVVIKKIFMKIREYCG